VSRRRNARHVAGHEYGPRRLAEHCHSNTPRDTISRLETLSLMSGLDLPVRVISKQIASAVQIIVQQARLSDGSRKITHITEVQGMEGDTLLLQDLFLFEQKGRGPDGKSLAGTISTGFPSQVRGRYRSRRLSAATRSFCSRLNLNGRKADFVRVRKSHEFRGIK
jgi:hypothetical protein